MTSTSWFKLFGIGACAALAAAACTVSSGEGEDDDITTGAGGTGGDGGSGGSGGDSDTNTTSNTTSTSSNTTSGTTSSTTSGTTSSTTGGGTGGEQVDCLDDEDGELPGEVATCEFEDDAETNCCDRCIVARCCEAYSECYAFDPNNICGGTAEGYESDSEIYAFQSCMLDIDGGAIAGTEEGSDFEGCIFETTEVVSAAECGNGTISGPTNELAFCMAGGEEGIDGCFSECLDSEFDETECTY